MDIGDIKYLAPAKVVLKLSEAMRIGAQKRLQCRSRFFQAGMTCALGAAYEAMTGEPPAEDADYADVLPTLGINQCFAEKIAYKNDSGWTRESIADWLAMQGY